MNDEELIKKTYIRYWEMMINKDAEGLRGVLAEDYYLLHMTGVRQTREVFLKGLLDGTFNYYSAEHDDIEVSVNGDTATMTGKSRVLAAVYGGGKHIWRLRGDSLLRKENGKWVIAGTSATTY